MSAHGVDGHQAVADAGAFRDVGKDGQIEYTNATIHQDSYFYLAGRWQLVGTEIDRVVDVANYAQGTEIFRGAFAVHSTVLGDFAGSFVWLENASGFGGPSMGRATDGSGRLWKAIMGSVDPAASLPLPECMAGSESGMLNLVQIVTPWALSRSCGGLFGCQPDALKACVRKIVIPVLLTRMRSCRTLESTRRMV